MKKLLLFLLPAVAITLCSCITKVMVDSPDHPVAVYDDLTCEFTGKITGSLANVFKATNIALERDMGFYRVGQIAKDREWFVYARGKRDLQIVVNLSEEKTGVIAVNISYGEDDLVACQKIFKAILTNMKAYQ